MGEVVALAAVVASGTRQEFIERIRGAWHNSRGEIFAIGNALCEARQKLVHGEFTGMVENDLPFGPRQAQLFMRLVLSPQIAKANHDAGLPNDWNAMVLIDRLKDEELEAGIAQGVIREGVTRAEIVQFTRGLRTAHEHAPGAKPPRPARPESAGARSYNEVVYQAIEWRKSQGLSQAALDDKIGWGEGQVSHYETGHSTDGKIFSLWNRTTGTDGTLFDYLAGLGLGIQLVPLG